MGLVSSWEQKGIDKGREEGLHEGKEEILARILRKRFSTLPEDITIRLDKLTSEQMNELSDELFNFTSLDDLKKWLAQQY